MRYRHTRAGAVILGALLVSVAPSKAQAGPAFEVASVKPHQAGDQQRSLPQFLPGGRFLSRGMPLIFVISLAYGVGFQSPRLLGRPDWIYSPQGVYDIEATAATGALPAGLSDKERQRRERSMLQALLAERFHLKVHRETRVLPLYALVVAKGGPKLEKSKTAEADCAENAGSTGAACHTIMGGRGRGLHGEAVTVGDIAAYVENWTDRPLLDETGISGLFNVQTTGWIDLQPGAAPAPGAKAEDGSDMADIPSLFTVLDRLGLKMEARKGPVDVVVIDHLEKPPAN